MGLLSRFKSKTSPERELKKLPWKPLNALHQLPVIQDRSRSKLQIIFKYSSRCGISRMILNHMESKYDITESQADLYFLDLISYRAVSDAVAERFDVWHESPQIILIRDGKVVAHGSHGSISAMDIMDFID